MKKLSREIRGGISSENINCSPMTFESQKGVYVPRLAVPQSWAPNDKKIKIESVGSILLVVFLNAVCT